VVSAIAPSDHGPVRLASPWTVGAGLRNLVRKKGRTAEGGSCAGGAYKESVNLRPCLRCGSTLTSAFRFCPGCGLPSDGSSSALERRRRPRRPARRMRWRAVGRSAGQPLASVARAARRLPRRISAFAHPFQRRFNVRARQLVAASGGATRLLVEIIFVSASSARDYLRSMVLLRRLHARRAEVIYSTGCAALSGDDGRVEQARAELRRLDELIAAASDDTTFAFTPGESAAAAPAEPPTEESVLMPRPRLPA
jgi:hypothetical protein